MKLKSLLFGSAAALMAVTGAQAAEPLEPIAEPVDYVRICDAFGTGFFYIPGTDTCLKIGGYVRSDFVYSHDWGDAHIRTADRFRNPLTGSAMPPSGGLVPVPPTVTADGRVIIPSHVASDRNFNEFATRARARLNIDTRTQTDIGMIRTYFDLWFTVGPGDTGNYAGTGSLLRQAFIQVANDWGTMTFGRADTFFEFYESSAWATRGIGEDAPLSPVNLAAATFNLGGGVSATIALEDSATDNHRRTGFGGHGFFPVDLNQDGIADTVALGGALGTQPGSILSPRAGTLTGIHGGNPAPDVVANIRVDQAWGSAQVMGALHPIRARAFTGPDLAPDQEPDTEFGWAVGAGAGLDIPGTGITFNIQGVYSDGAPGYATDGGAGFLTDGVVTGQFAGFRSLGGGAVTCVAAPGATGPAPCSLISTGIDTTEAWSVKAGLDGNLAPDWVFNLQGFYAEVDTPDVLGAPIARDRHGSTFSVAGPTAVQTTVFHPASGGTPAHLDAGPVISSDFDYWGVSGLVAWTPVSGFITGIELGYEKTEFDAGGDLDRWGGIWRVQKSF